jgi:hypothetical protein
MPEERYPRQALFSRLRSPGAAPPKPLSLQSVGTFKLLACCPHRGTGMSEHMIGRNGVPVSGSYLN